MTEEQRKAVDNIMDWFDFEKVHKTMKTQKIAGSSPAPATKIKNYDNKFNILL
jgi:hypothetical protein